MAQLLNMFSTEYSPLRLVQMTLGRRGENARKVLRVVGVKMVGRQSEIFGEKECLSICQRCLD